MILLIIASVVVAGMTSAAPMEIEALITGDEGVAAAAAEALAVYPPDSLAAWIRNFDGFPDPDTAGWAIELRHPINDSLTAPAWLFIPTGYDPKRPTPLVISLHGGVSGSKFRDASAKNWLDEPVIQIAEREGWLTLYPLGMTGCAWWDSTGMKNILWYIRELKRRFNVDDDRVAMCGFSDGGSGSFHFAMLAPTDFAVFFPWSGSPAVGTLVSGIETYLSNLGNRPLFASNGGLDRLYPAAGLEHVLSLALDVAPGISVAFYDTAGHNYGYMPAEWDRMAHRFGISGRNPFSPSIYYETSGQIFNSVDWLKIGAVDTTLSAAPWHSDINTTFKDERMTIGFNPDMEYKGKGVRIGFVTDDLDAPAVKASMEMGDVLTGIDKFKISGMADIVKAKEGRKRGDPILLIFKRGSKTMKVETFYPPVREFGAFPRTMKSAAIAAKRVGNSFIIQTMRVRSFQLLLSPELIRFDQPIKVSIGESAGNYEPVYNGLVQPDSRTLLEQFLIDRDRTRLVYAYLHVDVP